jgi:hypothetical protein
MSVIEKMKAAVLEELKQKLAEQEKLNLKPGVTVDAYKFASAFGLGRQLQSQTNTPSLRGGSQVPSSGSYAVLDKDVVESGTISLLTSPISLSGANSTTVSSVGFAFTWATPAATIYWDGTNGSKVVVQRRSDRTRQVIPPGSITVTGLLGLTRYYMLPFNTPSNRCTVGFVQGTVGTPAIFFTDTTDLSALQQQNYQEREPLSNGYIYIDTPAGATGGGGSGGSGGCPMLGTDIQGLDGAEVKTTNYKWHDWWHIETAMGGVNVVPEHPFYDENGFRKQAKDFEMGDLITHRNGFYKITDSYGFLRSCTKVGVKVERNGLYWANGYLSHNNKVAPE